jgi:hypothetical protein
MTQAFDLTDVPAVTLAEMWLPMRIALDGERGLVFLRGGAAAELAAIEARFWHAYRGDAARGTAILIRFRRLAEAFGGRRLRDLLMRNGFRALAPALAAAAQLRLNAGWGFAPQRLLWAMTQLDQEGAEMQSRETRFETPALAA